MKRGVAYLLVIAACGACSSTSVQPSVSPTAAVTPVTPTDRFIALVNTPKYASAGLMAYTSKQLLGLARSQCHDFNELKTQGDRGLAVSDLVRVGWDTVAAAALVDAADKTIC